MSRFIIWCIVGFCANFLCTTVRSLPASLPTCQEPTLQELQNQHHQVVANDAPNLLYYPGKTPSDPEEGLSQLVVQSDPESDIFLFGDKNETHCSKSHVECDNGLAHCSFCPFYHVISHAVNIISHGTESTRISHPIRTFPHEIAEARCRCSQPEPSNQGYCRALQHLRRILVKSLDCGEDGKYIYTPAWQRVTLGCVLVRENTTAPGRLSRWRCRWRWQTFFSDIGISYMSH